MSILSVNVKKLRKRTGITAEQLAESLGVGKTTISNIETGYLAAPPVNLLERMAELFGTTVDGITGKTALDVKDRARLVHVVSSMSAKTAIVEADKVVDGIFMDRDKLRGHDWFGIVVRDNALSGVGIFMGYTAIVKMNVPVKNNDIVVASVEGEDEAILRIYHKMGDIVTLKAKNNSGFYKDIIIDTRKDSLKIIGKVEKCEFEL